MPKIIYLDQNAWINLFKEDQGKTDDPELKQSLKAVIKTSESGGAIYPISLIHLIETSSIREDKKRENFFEFMWRISKGHAIIPYTRIIKHEIDGAVFKRVGLPTVDLREIVIGKGLPFIFGARPVITKKYKDSSEIHPDLRKKLLGAVKDPKMILWSMKNKKIVEGMRKTRLEEIGILEELEKIREEDEKVKDKDLKRRFSIARFLINDITPEIARVTTDLGFDKELVMSKNITREEIETLFRDIPTAYTTWELTFRRDSQGHRKINKNDLNDIAALSIAIPYCDIVVTEKMWTSISLQAKLDKTYNTIILYSMKDLHGYIEDKK